jgi:hypothetical protein
MGGYPADSGQRRKILAHQRALAIARGGEIGGGNVGMNLSLGLALVVFVGVAGSGVVRFGVVERGGALFGVGLSVKRGDECVRGGGRHRASVGGFAGYLDQESGGIGRWYLPGEAPFAL